MLIISKAVQQGRPFALVNILINNFSDEKNLKTCEKSAARVSEKEANWGKSLWTLTSNFNDFVCRNYWIFYSSNNC